jgi:flagellar basal-body rod protein FlgB
MDGVFDPIFRGLQGALDVRLERHGLIAANLANAETPHYLPREMNFEALLHAHMREAREDLPETEVFEDPAALPQPNGNAVDLDREMVHLAQNGGAYDTAMEVLSRKLALLRYAAADGRTG